VLSLGAGAQVLFSDDFNRPDSSNLGPSWTQVAGSSIGISGNAAIATTHDFPLAIVNGISVGYQDAVLTVDALHPAAGSLDYVALVYGYKDNDHCLFVKVQQQGANQYNWAAFYYGNNNLAGGDFFSLSTPFDSARIGTWALDADKIRLGIDTDFDGVWDQTYDYVGVSSLTLGTGVGLGMYSSNSVLADNFVVSGKSAGHGDVPEPSTVVFAVGAVLGGVLLRRRK
jgi:hypothetical protein